MEQSNWTFQDASSWGNQYPNCSASEQSPINIETEKKAYNLSKVFLKSLTANEILSPINSMEDILYKLFNSFKIKIHKYLEIIEKCRCNLEKIEQTIKNISNEQIKDLIYEDGSLEIKCEFCKNTRKYLKSDLIRIRN